MGYISKLVSIDEVRKWNDEIYCIDAQTGKGKTTFCFDTLSTIAHERNKKILMFVNRSALNSQLNREKMNVEKCIESLN